MAMDDKAVIECSNAINKAQNRGDPPSVTLEQLNKLKVGFKPSEDLLRSTKIGVVVNKLKSNADKDIARTANELVKKWKAEIGKGGSHSYHNRAGQANPKTTASPGPQGQGQSAPEGRSHVAPDKRNAKADRVDTKVTGNAIRDNCLELMYNGLAHMTSETPKDVLRVATAVENAAYDTYKPETSAPYKEKMRSLFQNLKNKSNPGLRKRVLSGEVTPSKFVVMTHDELKSAERREEEQRMHKENVDNAMIPQEEKNISGSLTCPRCHKKLVSYTQAQTRSADEPMTTFCHCTGCDHRWKFS